MRVQRMVDHLGTIGETRRSLLTKGALGIVGLVILDLLFLAAAVALIRWVV